MSKDIALQIVGSAFMAVALAALLWFAAAMCDAPADLEPLGTHVDLVP